MEILFSTLVVIGVIMSLVNLPGSFLIVGVMIVQNMSVGETIFPYWIVALLLLLAILGTFVDNIFMLWGANKYGASKWGMIGVVVGFIIGLISANPVIIIVGPFALAYLLETTIANKDHKSAINAVKGSVIGGFAGYFAKFLLALFIASIYFFILK